MTTGEQLTQFLRDQLKAEGRDLKVSEAEAATYVDERVANLTLAASEPGYAQVQQAAADNVALYAAGAAVDSADGIDQRIIGLVRGALALAVPAVA